MEVVAVILFLLIVVLLLAGPVLSVLALVQIGKLNARIRELEKRLTSQPKPAEQETAFAEPEIVATLVEEPVATTPTATRPALGRGAGNTPFDLEGFLGRKALGWFAVILLLFGVSFFLRYAFENNWIGPMGQVALGVAAGTTLAIFGWWCDRARSWHIFSQIVTTAGLLLLYLSTYAGFGYYTILSCEVGSCFLLLVVASGALLAVVYNARTLALMTIIGGLLVPLLLHSPHDRYEQLFIYLTLLNVAILAITFWRNWSSVSIVSQLGTQGLFWLWYVGNYHPEKLGWALGFQLALLLLFLAHSLFAHVLRPRRANAWDLIRLTLTAFAWFAAAYILLKPDYRPWLGSLAIIMAASYTAWARFTLWLRASDTRQTLVSLAIAVSFTTIALPIEANARWVALGWAVESVALWWFGTRVRLGHPLRGMAAGLTVLAVGRVLFIDTPWQTRAPFIPILNTYALPSLGVAACLIGVAWIASGRPQEVGRPEREVTGLVGLVGVLLVWVILSVDTYSYFDAYAALEPSVATRWRWLGQLTLSALWAIYASTLLGIGFWRMTAALRWTALALYGITIAKVFFYDMADLGELYRIGAFILVSIILATAAWAYQRFAPQLLPAETTGDHS